VSWDSPEYNRWHQDRCAEIVASGLRERGASEELVRETAGLVRVHEEGGAQKVGEDALRELARIGADLEQRLGRAQDIEWAIEAGELHVLQARPVTVQ